MNYLRQENLSSQSVLSCIEIKADSSKTGEKAILLLIWPSP